MAKIESYPLASPVVGQDKWLGTDSANANATKNFSADAVALFLNTYNKIEDQALRYKYQDLEVNGYICEYEKGE